MILVDKNGAKICELEPETDLLSETSWFRLYRSKSLDGKQSYLLRVPTDECYNGEINLEAVMLAHFEDWSNSTESDYSKAKGDPNARIHYDWLFPKLVGSFLTGEDQAFRQVNLLSVRDALVEDFVPMVKLMEKYKVDAKTGAWILGRFYKLQTFLEDCGGLYNFNVDGVILEPRMHRMVYLGFPCSGELCDWDKSVRNATSVILDWIENDGTEHEEDFRGLLEWICDENNGRKWSGTDAHCIFYKQLDVWWGHKYHPFTYMNRETGEWQTITETPKF